MKQIHIGLWKLLLFLLPPVKFSLAGQTSNAGHAVGLNHFRFSMITVSLMLPHGQWSCHETSGTSLQTLILLPKNSSKRRLQALLLCRSCGRCGSFLCE